MAFDILLMPAAETQVLDFRHQPPIPFVRRRGRNPTSGLREPADRNRVSEEIRQLLYGKRRHIHRILFTVSGTTVRILHIRHGARRLLDE